MTQPVKYWTTNIDAGKSAAEIMGLIVRYGGRQTSLEWDNGQPTAISFVIRDERMGRDVPVHLEARVDAVKAMILKERPYTNRRSAGSRADYELQMEERARRIIWRHLRDLIEQQLLAVEIGAFDLTDVFMSGLVLQDGRTLGMAVRERQLGGAEIMALPEGRGS